MKWILFVLLVLCAYATDLFPQHEIAARRASLQETFAARNEETINAFVNKINAELLNLANDEIVLTIDSPFALHVIYKGFDAGYRMRYDMCAYMLMVDVANPGPHLTIWEKGHSSSWDPWMGRLKEVGIFRYDSKSDFVSRYAISKFYGNVTC